MPSTSFPDPLYCPRCGTGIAAPIAHDEHGTNYACANCGHGFTKPASDAEMSSPPLIPDSIAGSDTKGDPGAGSVLPDGTSAGRAVPSKHPDAGPGVAPVQPTEAPSQPPDGTEDAEGAGS